ncbi:uncharacterized protein [Misgurnus anguillicaudatus]|uniref:uncharacterized protein n=1 Tax=Misgurnus anguillicaudatus TaxID=75329 RepID=UPI003CCFA8A4
MFVIHSILHVKMKWNEFIFVTKGTNKEFLCIKQCESPSDDNIKEAIKNLRMGDLILRKTTSLIPIFYHVGLYNGELVVDFSVPSNPSFSAISTSHLSSGGKGLVSYKSVKNFIVQKPFIIYRPRITIPPNFSEVLQNALDYTGIYHPLNNNCLHFALRLLGLSPGKIPESLQQETEESNVKEGENLTLKGLSVSSDISNRY